MNTNNTPVVVYVAYQGRPQEHFDRDYYIKIHLPLAMKHWEKYGLLGLNAFYPADERNGTVALCECVFRDEAALEAAFASPEAAEVMADVSRFTAIAPRRARAVAL